MGMMHIQAGERMASIHGGGGGYGPPTEREPERVGKDVIEGYVTRERAENVYGVILDDDLNLDMEKTAAKRAVMSV